MRYLQTDTGPEGPYSLADLKKRACHGVLVGTSLLSESAEGPWEPASGMPELELEWVVVPENGTPFPPCHALALRDWVQSGEVQPYWTIQHLPTGESYDVVDTLCSALLTQNKVLEVQVQAFAPALEAHKEQGVEIGDAVENLLRSLEIKSELLADAKQKIAILESERDIERVRREEEVKQSTERMEELTTHLNEMDEAMSALTQKYRDLNDRFIQMRNQASAGER